MHKTVRGDCRVSDCARTEMSDPEGKGFLRSGSGAGCGWHSGTRRGRHSSPGSQRSGQQKGPFLGINLGHLGYLAEIEEQNVTSALDRLIEGCYTVENRMMLEGTVYREGKQTFHDLALNDIVMNRSGNLRVVNYDVYVNDEYLNSFTADGMIVSTPTGSTGYSLSAGGPIVSPTASMLVLTPICPHTLNSRSIVFSGDDRIRIEIGEGRRNGPDEACVTFDGDTCEELKTGDYVEIHKSCEVTKILKINQVSFLEVLRDKLSRR